MRYLAISFLLTGTLAGCVTAAPTALEAVNLAYTVANTGTFVVTEKSLTDTIVSEVVGGDCNALNVLDDKYYCEMRDIGVTYNRNPF